MSGRFGVHLPQGGYTRLRLSAGAHGAVRRLGSRSVSTEPPAYVCNPLALVATLLRCIPSAESGPAGIHGVVRTVVRLEWVYALSETNYATWIGYGVDFLRGVEALPRDESSRWRSPASARPVPDLADAADGRPEPDRDGWSW
jgi:hypothetical protein